MGEDDLSSFGENNFVKLQKFWLTCFAATFTYDVNDLVLKQCETAQEKSDSMAEHIEVENKENGIKEEHFEVHQSA